MGSRINRREFMTASGMAAVAGCSRKIVADAPQIFKKGEMRAVVVASANGNRSKDADGLTCVAKAFAMMSNGADVLEAVIAGVNIVELDPEDNGVGYGGLPNAEGVVQLDASVMDGKRKRA